MKTWTISQKGRYGFKRGEDPVKVVGMVVDIFNDILQKLAEFEEIKVVCLVGLTWSVVAMASSDTMAKVRDRYGNQFDIRESKQDFVALG